MRIFPALLMILFTAGMLHAEKINILEEDLSAVVETYQKTGKFNSRSFYLWSGALSDVSETDYGLLVTLQSARWIDKNTIQSYNAELKVTQPAMIAKIRSIRLRETVMVILEINDIKGQVPVCTPVIIKKL